MKLQEKYSRATQSGNLKSDTEHFTTDVLAAVALSGDLPCLLYRVKYALDASSYPRLKAKWEEKVEKKALYRKWPDHIKPYKVASMSLKYWVNDKCAPCEGRGFEKHESAPTLTDKACKECFGTGTALLVCNKTYSDYVLAMVEDLNHLASQGAKIAMKKLREDSEL